MFVTSKQERFVAQMWGQRSFEAGLLTGTRAPEYSSQCPFFVEINEMAPSELGQLLHTFLSEQKVLSCGNWPQCLPNFVPPSPASKNQSPAMNGSLANKPPKLQVKIKEHF